MTLFDSNARLFKLAESDRKIVRDALHALPKAYTIEKAKNGSPILAKNGKPFASAYNPEREGEALANRLQHGKKNYFLFFGLGAGYHLLSFAQKKEALLGAREYAAITLFIVEPDVSLLALALSAFDFSPLAAFTVRLFIGVPSASDLAKATNPALFKGLAFLPLPALSNDMKRNAQTLKDDFLKEIEKEYANFLTRFHFESIWTRNLIANAPLLPESVDLESLKDRFAHATFVIAASGPTLTKDIPALIARRNTLCIIAVDTAYAPLMKAGITPDIVVSVDAGFFNALDFVYASSAFPLLIADLIAYPAVMRLSQSMRTAFFVSDAYANALRFVDHLSAEANVSFPRLQVSSTVGSAAVSVALYLGATRVVFSGNDLSYPYYHTHAPYTAAHEWRTARSNRLRTTLGMELESVLERAKERTKNGLPTDFAMAEQKEWYEALPERYPNVRFFTSSNMAQRFKGMRVYAFKDEEAPVAFAAAVQAMRALSVSNNALLRYAKQMEKELHDLIDYLNAQGYALTHEAIERPDYEALALETMARLERALARMPFLQSAIGYLIFSLSRREGDDIRQIGALVVSEALSASVYFKTRFNRMQRALAN